MLKYGIHILRTLLLLVKMLEFRRRSAYSSVVLRFLNLAKQDAYGPVLSINKLDSENDPGDHRYIYSKTFSYSSTAAII